MSPDSTEALAAAHARLLTEGRPLTVRALRQAASVGTDAAGAWLRDHEPATGVPAIPDLSDALKIIWSAAWTTAEAQSRHLSDARLVAARQGEAEALSAADAATLALSEARRAEASAVQRANNAESRALEAGKQLSEAKTALNSSDQSRRTAEIAQGRAEAEADSLRRTLDELREDLRAALRRPEAR